MSSLLDGAFAPPALVVIGTSMGGVEALSLLLTELPAACTVPLLLVIHLPRDRDNLLPRLFRGVCARPVEEALDKQPIDAGTVYIAPPDYHLLVETRGQLALSVDEPVHFCRPAIDLLFESAADIYGRSLLAIVLTGNNDDGAAGLAAVQRAGGRTIVQDPATARAPAMPRAALGRVPGAETMTLPEIAALLRTFDGEPTR